MTKLKRQWIGHIAKHDTDRRTVKLTHWKPKEIRSVKSPEKRRLDDIRKHVDGKWFQLAQEINIWKEAGDAYVY